MIARTVGRTMFNAESDCDWLRTTHLKSFTGLPPFHAFVLYGNEDTPERVDLYAERNPAIESLALSIYF